MQLFRAGLVALAQMPEAVDIGDHHRCPRDGAGGALVGAVVERLLVETLLDAVAVALQGMGWTSTPPRGGASSTRIGSQSTRGR
ncbi:hypothetical protein [Actinomyces ruminis]|uniref:hypothetical protein n=1 Tax=Actinomyces ruminis TaxID=1937003 RepID=UPI001C557537|nr:hypothetical protein [Actinomyces ruminis]